MEEKISISNLTLACDRERGEGGREQRERKVGTVRQKRKNLIRIGRE